ncbi:MAG: hypothetical protein ACLTER_03555 [Ruminococcus sp.]
MSGRDGRRLLHVHSCKGVPKGSGLGTSSILSGACVRALGKFMGTNWS